MKKEDTKKEKIVEEKKSDLKEVQPQKKKRNKKFILLYVALAAFVVYAAFTIINQSIEISDKKAELSSINKQLEIVEIKSDYLKEIKNYKGKDLSEYMENIAREDLDYIKNGERVFVNVSGD